ncbi:alpha/beta fold hydrolase [Salinisphaera orenii]|uniref:alpha/beta fold hydrolase n=1 Tax=Salinisphaera orenii TaxID=856731 RepID=UPI0013A6214E
MLEHDFITLSNRELHVRVWNRSADKTLICWHILARNGADFEPLADALAKQGWRVLAPDTIDRGWSQWAKRPRKEYQFETYSALALGLLEHYRVDRLHWLGTSMGGLLGMVLKSGPLASRIERLILNDIGPAIPTAALRRIANYVRETPAFDTLSLHSKSAFEPSMRRSANATTPVGMPWRWRAVDAYRTGGS